MLRFVRKHQKSVIIAVVVLLALTAAFFWGGRRSEQDAVSNDSAESLTLSSKSSKSSISDSSTGKASSADEEKSFSDHAAVSDRSEPTSSGHKREEGESTDSVIRQESSGETHEPEHSETSMTIVSEATETTESSSEMSVPVIGHHDTYHSEPTGTPTDSGNDSSDSSAPSQQSSRISQDDVSQPERSCCTVSISCETLLTHMDDLKKNKRSLVPENGVLLSAQSVTLEEGDSVFSVTRRLCQEQGISFEFTLAPIYHTAYVEGIGNLYEFDCGSGSGWLFSVNGTYPGYGCSDYTVQDGDIICWQYTCEMGHDLTDGN